MATSGKRKFSGIFSAEVTFGPVHSLNTVKGMPYGRSVASVKTGKGEVGQRTVMAFGKAYETVAADFVEGGTATLAVQYEGGTVRVVGYPREAAAQAA